MKLVFALLGIAAIAAAILFEGGSLRDFLHPTSGLLVVGATVALSLAHHSAAKLSAAFKAALGREPFEDQRDLQDGSSRCAKYKRPHFS